VAIVSKVCRSVFNLLYYVKVFFLLRFGSCFVVRFCKIIALMVKAKHRNIFTCTLPVTSKEVLLSQQQFGLVIK